MIRLGIVGTNWITMQFIEAALKSQMYELTSVYSRNLEKAQVVADKYGARFVSADFLAYVNSSSFDVVYIASPNALHFEQAIACMQAKKHVIVEKPIFSNTTEFQAAKKVATENHVMFFEAARHIHEENFLKIAEKVKKLPEITGASFNYMKYSSRYDLVLKGEEPNIFSSRFSGGALMDLGVYPLYTAIYLFGMPKEGHYFAEKISTGVDGSGTIILVYDDFHVTILCGKISNAFLANEIYSGKTTIQFDHISEIHSGKQFIDGHIQELPFVKAEKNPMLPEAKVFATILKNPQNEVNKKSYQELLMLSEQVNIILEKLRKSAGIYFPANQKAD